MSAYLITRISLNYKWVFKVEVILEVIFEVEGIFVIEDVLETGLEVEVFEVDVDFKVVLEVGSSWMWFWLSLSSYLTMMMFSK